MKTFKDFLIEATTTSNAVLSLERYTWGELRKIEVGNKFTVLIHPEDWDVITKSDSGKFKDEQKITWSFNKDGDFITFSASGANRARVTVSLSELDKPKNTKRY